VLSYGRGRVAVCGSGGGGWKRQIWSGGERRKVWVFFWRRKEWVMSLIFLLKNMFLKINNDVSLIYMRWILYISANEQHTVSEVFKTNVLYKFKCLVETI